MARRFYTRLQRQLRQQGWRHTLASLYQRAQYRYRYLRDDVLFDKRYGVETRRIESAYLSQQQSDYLDSAEFYEPSRWRHFSRMLAHLSIQPSDFHFMDIGAGKGRVLMFADRAGFHQITGVELAPQLVETAQRNVQRYRQKTGSAAHFDIRCEDVAHFQVPAGNLLIYLYNPFRGELMQLFLDKLQQAQQGDRLIYVLYRNPACAELFAARRAVQCLVLNNEYGIYQVISTRR
ncbi:class I SAM-dependent methyltransferase [Pokkaliibacter sp. MBI-7]|uniref:class I SAM-dependent methyltransferase n=1 Tax=Pokkaliibacter sp. MBI-7 TaxID=3040600 RepID=UPI00244B9CF2|nr:class I SAM-dependent methyltransferase [Pokkaliibacter sp. MBI-7]MDH2433015.1 class I SAM-dependent methyltransferase [Pokkaliibacter sp. MBI-7]